MEVLIAAPGQQRSAQDGQRIETVIMRYGDVELRNFPEHERERLRKDDGTMEFASNKRATVCVSSQVRSSILPPPPPPPSAIPIPAHKIL